MPKVQAIETGAGSGRARTRRVVSSLNEINVVPLVDVMLVLLIIFMVTAPMLQRGLDVNLPSARRAQEINDQRIFVSVPLSFRNDHLVHLGDEPVRLEILQERIRQAMVGKADHQVFLQSDAGLSVQDLISVMDKLKEGGVEKVGIVAKWPDQR
ncbi:MAG TPA: biopolymer transporter ExbD [Vicinamibacterales bacterium]|jgi:biopolymer transport protein ExbD